MLRKLTESDREKLMMYLKNEPEINLFIIGDVENFGFNSDFQDLWAYFDDNENYEAVLLRYYNSFIFYTHKEDFNLNPVADKLNKAITNGEALFISGKKSLMDKLYPLLPESKILKVKNTYFTSCKEINKDFPVYHLEKVRYAVTNDIDDICDLLDRIDEFATLRNRPSMVKKIEMNAGKINYIRDMDNGKVIATASTTAENKYSAMIVAVATDPDFRKKGYASACVYDITRRLFDEGKSACLFFDNPEAGSIYKKLGYKEIDKWVMIQLKQS